MTEQEYNRLRRDLDREWMRKINQLDKLWRFTNKSNPPRVYQNDVIQLGAKVLGKRGGVIGGPARARALSPERRKEIGRKAIAARWAKHRASLLLRDGYLTEQGRVCRAAPKIGSSPAAQGGKP